MKNWSVGQKISGGFAVMAVLAVLAGSAALVELRTVVRSEDELDVRNENRLDVEVLRGNMDEEDAALYALMAVAEQRHLELMRKNRSDAAAALARLRSRLTDADGRALLDQIERLEAERQPMFDKILATRVQAQAQELAKGPLTGAAADAKRLFTEEVEPRTERLHEALAKLSAREEKELTEGRGESHDIASRALTLVSFVSGLAVLLAAVLAVMLGRSLTRQLGLAINSIRSSSAELNAAANQQATGSTQQATATVEITTTVRELLATSKQISESSQRVARIAQDAATAATGGDHSVQKAQSAISGIRRQVDLVVNHMLDLGKKSQQIGGILEVINELAEQTNILAINATIESAGAGDAGKRFAVVADEIRKLADRVSGSSREIRGLIEDIRSSANTTVMATEDGSKAVDEGARQFGDVASGFQQIAQMVQTTRDAAREIELSTKQQTTAVEQVNLALANVSQAAKESEASARQTSATSSELANLSTQLAALVRGGGARA